MKNIVICGSVKVREQLYKTAEKLKEMGYNPLLPVECLQGLDKMIASRAHLDRVVDSKNEIILIVNATKNNIDNYIGPNTFAEIAFGFYYRKRLYLLNDIYEPFIDELEGWHVKPLKGDLKKLVEEEKKEWKKD